MDNQLFGERHEQEENGLYGRKNAELCDLHNVVSMLVCDIEKGTRCKDSFPDYKDGKCRVCGGQAN